MFFRKQDINIDDQKLLGTKLGELSGKPGSSKLHVHPITEETSELGDEVSIISSERRAEYDRWDKTKLSASVFVHLVIPLSFSYPEIQC